MSSFRRALSSSGSRDRRGGLSSSSSPTLDQRPLLDDHDGFDDHKSSGGGDAAAQLLRKMGQPAGTRIKVTTEDNDRVLRRIDLGLLPLMLGVYFLQGTTTPSPAPTPTSP